LGVGVATRVADGNTVAALDTGIRVGDGVRASGVATAHADVNNITLVKINPHVTRTSNRITRFILSLSL